MERTADGYYDAHNLMDLHILSPLGLTDEDIAVLAASRRGIPRRGGHRRRAGPSGPERPHC